VAEEPERIVINSGQGLRNGASPGPFAQVTQSGELHELEHRFLECAKLLPINAA